MDKPAFPRPYSVQANGEQQWEQDGMTLREYYAGLFAVQYATCVDYVDTTGCKVLWPKERIVKMAATLADLLIAELEKRP